MTNAITVTIDVPENIQRAADIGSRAAGMSEEEFTKRLFLAGLNAEGEKEEKKPSLFPKATSTQLPPSPSPTESDHKPTPDRAA